MKSIPPSRFVARAILLIAIVGGILMAPTAASAQCSAPETSQAIEAAQSVFVGRVSSTDELGRIARVEVLSVWKGRDLPREVEVRGASSSDSAPLTIDRRFDVGATYLVVPENGRNPFLATNCSATQRYTNAPNLIPVIYQEAAGATTGRVPPEAPRASAADEEAALTTSILPLLGALGLVALIWGAVVWSRSHRPERLEEAVEKPKLKTEQPKKPRRVRRRNFAKDAAGAEKATKRTLRRHSRGLRGYRRRQNRQVAASRKASGSTDTS